MLPPLGLGSNDVIAMHHCSKTQDMLIEIGDYQQLLDITPDFAQLFKVSYPDGLFGLIVTSTHPADDIDFASRFFTPWYGIDEDPVTGAAHTVLGPYWQQKLGKSEFRAYQASSRGGKLKVVVLESGRTLLEGESQTVLRGKIRISG